MILLDLTKQSSAERPRGLIGLHVANCMTRKAFEVSLVGQGGLVDTGFNRDIVMFRLADLLSTIVVHEPDLHDFTLKLVNKDLYPLPDEAQKEVKKASDCMPDSGLLEHLSNLDVETTIRSGTGWSFTHLLGWPSQHLPSIS